MGNALRAGVCQLADGLFDSNTIPTLDELQRQAWKLFGIAVMVGEVPETRFFAGVKEVPSVLCAPSVPDALLYLAGVKE